MSTLYGVWELKYIHLKMTLSAILGVCFLSSCSQVPTKVDQNILNAKNAATVIAIGPNIVVSTLGVTAFGNSVNPIPVPEWNIDGIASDEIAKILPNKIKIVRGSADGIVALPDPEYYDYKSTVAERAKRQIHLPHTVDIIILLTATGTGQATNYNDNTYSFDAGLGVSRRKSLVLPDKPYVHAFMRLAILDGRTFTPLADTILKIPSHSDSFSMIDQGMSLPVKSLDNFEWNEKWEDMTQEQHELIHRTLLSLITDGIDATLPKMFGLNLVSLSTGTPQPIFPPAHLRN